MTQFKIEKATKEQAKLRAALFGPSGAGKTYTALRIAKGLGGRVCVIDTERRTASKYSDRFEFDVLNMTDTRIEAYAQAIRVVADAGYEVLVVDSLSHAWQALLEEVDNLAQSRFRGNSFQAWSVGTPKQRLLVDAILDFPGHVLGTMRSKTEWTTSQNERGKTVPQRVGLTPEQGKGIEYEFDLLLELNTDHFATVLKDRTGKFQDQIIEKPGEDFGATLGAWLSDGVAPAPRVAGSASGTTAPATPATPEVLGDASATKMLTMFAEAGVVIETIRAHLLDEYPDAKATIDGSPKSWPAAWKPTLGAFLKLQQAASAAAGTPEAEQVAEAVGDGPY